MEGIINSVKESVMESMRGTSGNKNDSDLHQPSRNQGNAATYTANLDGSSNNYAESRAHIEGNHSGQGAGSYGSSGYRHENDGYSGQGNIPYGSSGKRQDYDSYPRQGDLSYGSRDNQPANDNYPRRDDNSYKLSGYGGHGGRSQDGYHSNYSVGYGGQDSTRDIRANYSREEGFSHRDQHDNMRGSSRYEADEGHGYQAHEGREGYGGPTGYGGHPGNMRQGYEDEFERGREYRPSQGSGGMMMMGNSGGGDYGEATRYAQQHFSSESSYEPLFSHATTYISGRERELEREHIDEEHFTRSHREIYENGGHSGEKSSVSLAQAAAMQTLKYFISGKSGSSEKGGVAAANQNAFIGMAMAEAAKLVDSQRSTGNVSAEANKQDVINQAAQIALKLFLKSKLDAAGGGSGGANGLMSMASKFFQ